MKAFWGVIECGRPGLPFGYLPGFMEAFYKASVGTLNTFFDEGMQKGQTRAYLEMIKAGLDSGADVLHLFEGDTRPCVGAFERVATHPIPPWAAFVAWYAQRTKANPCTETAPGFVRTPGGLYTGNQATTFTRAAAETVWHWFHQVATVYGRNAGDVLVREALQGYEYARHVPDIFQHVGAVSVAFPGKRIETRSSKTFRAELDARTLGVFT